MKSGVVQFLQSALDTCSKGLVTKIVFSRCGDVSMPINSPSIFSTRVGDYLVREYKLSIVVESALA